MNTILLEKVRDQIKAEPSQYNQAKWFSTSLPDGSKPANCGTAACIAGWAVAIGRGVDPATARKLNTFNPTMLLGLTSGQADRLYYEGEWPKQSQSTARASIETRANKAVARINHFIKTDGRE